MCIPERIRNAFSCFQTSKLTDEEINQKRIELLPFYWKHYKSKNY